MPKARVAVLISGNGSNLQALMDAARLPDYPAEIALVISNKQEAYGVKRAKQGNVPTIVIDHKNYESRDAFDAAMQAELEKSKIEYVCLAGFMRLLTPAFVKKWEGRVLNIHPSLLPQFKGANAVRDALAAGAKETGCTVHLVTAEMDSGPILAQARVKILPDDNHETLRARIHEQEHRLYPDALKKLMERD